MTTAFENNNLPTTSWVENLALEELNMEESGVVHFNDHLNPSYFLEESSIHLMDSLRERIELYVDKFNEYRGINNQIKIFKISNTVNDFMLFRNSLRLIIARKGHDLLTVGFLSSTGNLYGPRINSDGPVSNGPHEIRAHIGAFNRITWRFQNNIIEIDSMAKHYLSEFIRNSAR